MDHKNVCMRSFFSKRGIFVKKWFQATVFRYFISYFLIFCISVVGMFLLFRAHLVKTLTEQYTAQIQTELSSAASHLTDEINTLFTINTQVIGNADVMMAKYVELPGHTYQLQSELKKYVIGKPLIRSVGYIDKKAR